MYGNIIAFVVNIMIVFDKCGESNTKTCLYFLKDIYNPKLHIYNVGGKFNLIVV